MNGIISCGNKEGKDEEKVVYGEMKGVNVKGKEIWGIKSVKNMGIGYGGEMNDKMLKEVMEKVCGLYRWSCLNGVSLYVEKCGYGSKK